MGLPSSIPRSPVNTVLIVLDLASLAWILPLEYRRLRADAVARARADLRLVHGGRRGSSDRATR